MNPFDPSPASAGTAAHQARRLFLIVVAVTLLARGVLRFLYVFFRQIYWLYGLICWLYG